MFVSYYDLDSIQFHPVLRQTYVENLYLSTVFHRMTKLDLQLQILEPFADIDLQAQNLTESNLSE